MQIWTCFLFLSFFFSKNRGFIQEGNPSEKDVIVEEELNGIDVDDIANLQDSPRVVFMYEECENLIADGREITRSINQKKKSGVLQQLIDVHYITNAVDESISSVAMSNIVNQLG